MNFNLYPEMNSKISGLLRLSEQPAQVYAANLIDAYRASDLEPDEVSQLKQCLEIVEGQRDAALEDLYYIHCAGQKGCAICCNADQCGESDSHIGDCTGFEWRGPQRPKEAE